MEPTGNKDQLKNAFCESLARWMSDFNKIFKAGSELWMNIITFFPSINCKKRKKVLSFRLGNHSKFTVESKPGSAGQVKAAVEHESFYASGL